MTDPKNRIDHNHIPYKSLTALAAGYKPMSYRFLGIKRNEYLPRFVVLRPLLAIRRRIKTVMGWELTYFDLRASLTREQRKMGDLIFLTHFDKSHATDAENASRSERARYYWIKIRYLPEIIHINNQLYDKQEQPILKLPKEVEMYLLRWGYMMSVRPQFVELVHGTHALRAQESVSDLL
jgi:hypothetical protein